MPRVERSRCLCLRRLRQYKIGKVFEDPVVLECPIDDSQKLSRQGNDCLSRAAAVLDLFVVLLQILTVTLRDQSALDQRRSAELRATFGDAAAMLRLIRVGHAWNDPEVRSQIAFFGEIINVANDRQQNAAAQSSNPLDADQIRVALQLLTFLGDRLFQFGDTLVQAADLGRR